MIDWLLLTLVVKACLFGAAVFLASVGLVIMFVRGR